MNIISKIKTTFSNTLKEQKELNKLNAYLTKKYAPKSTAGRIVYTLFVIAFAISITLTLLFTLCPYINILNLSPAESLTAMMVSLLASFATLLFIMLNTLISKEKVTRNLYKDYQKLKEEKEN